ncbi:MAG: hypothetical protein V4616_14495 [Bacteroidota bacterium]
MENRSVKNKALLVAVVIHAAILGICLLITLLPPQPPFPEEVMIEVAMADLGSTPDGSGDVTPDNIALPSSNVKQNTDFSAQPIQPTTSPAPEMVTDENSTTVVNASTKPVKESKANEVPTNVPQTEVAPVQRVNTSALFRKGSNANTGGGENGGSEGDGQGLGDKGLADGVAGGKGLGIGNGTWILAGRSLLRAASIETTREEGIVVLKIWVDRRGNVFKAEPILEQCNTTSEVLFAKAKKAALEAKYDAKPDAAPEQVGKMTFKFILR